MTLVSSCRDYFCVPFRHLTQFFRAVLLILKVVASDYLYRFKVKIGQCCYLSSCIISTELASYAHVVGFIVYSRGHFGAQVEHITRFFALVLHFTEVPIYHLYRFWAKKGSPSDPHIHSQPSSMHPFLQITQVRSSTRYLIAVFLVSPIVF